MSSGARYFDTDLFVPIIERDWELLGIEYGATPAIDTALRILADHSRAAAFLIHDSVMPANDGRCYVVRKIIPWALRHAPSTASKGRSYMSWRASSPKR